MSTVSFSFFFKKNKGHEFGKAAITQYHKQIKYQQQQFISSSFWRRKCETWVSAVPPTWPWWWQSDSLT